MFTLVRKAGQKQTGRRGPEQSQRPSKHSSPAATHAQPSSESRAESRQSVYRDDDANRGLALHRAATTGSKMSGKAAALLGMHDAPIPSSTATLPSPAPCSSQPSSIMKPSKNWFRMAQRNLRSRPSQESLRSVDVRETVIPKPSAPADKPASAMPDKPRPNISCPSNFQHLTHTRPHHFGRMSTKSANDLLADFSAVRAGQSPAKDIQGIRTCSIRLRVTHSRESSTDRSQKSITTRPEDGKLNCLRAASLRSTSTRNSFNGFDKENRNNAIPEDGQYMDPTTGIMHNVWTDDRSINLRSSHHDEFGGIHALSTFGDVSFMTGSGGLPAVTEEVEETIASSRASSIARSSRRPPPSLSEVSLASSSHLWSPRKSSLPSWSRRIRRLNDDATSQPTNDDATSEKSSRVSSHPQRPPPPPPVVPISQESSNEPLNISHLPTAKARMSFGESRPLSQRNSIHDPEAGSFQLIRGPQDLQAAPSRTTGDETIADIDDWLASEFAGHNIKYQPSFKRHSTVNTPNGSPKRTTFGNTPFADPRSRTPPPLDNKEQAASVGTTEASQEGPPRTSQSALRHRRSNMTKKVSFSSDAPAPLTIRKPSMPSSVPSSCQTLTPTSATTAASIPLLTPTRSQYSPIDRSEAFSHEKYPSPKRSRHLAGSTCASQVPSVVDYRPTLAQELSSYSPSTPDFY